MSTVNSSKLKAHRKELRYWILLILFFSLCLPLAALAAPGVSSRELLTRPEKYDGKEIVYQGEAIGDMMKRGNSAWVNVRDVDYALGVFCPIEEAAKITCLGGYKFKGDIIAVQGVFHHSCAEHGGDPDIHARRIKIIQPGIGLAHSLHPDKVQIAIILSSAAILLALIHWILGRIK